MHTISTSGRHIEGGANLIIDGRGGLDDGCVSLVKKKEKIEYHVRCGRFVWAGEHSIQPLK